MEKRECPGCISAYDLHADWCRFSSYDPPSMADRDEPPIQATPEEIKRFDEASNHPYECNCDLCKEWWEQVPPEDPGDPDAPAF